ncbi:hypothetical protein ANCDUO_22324 [Ancylostoma duodenale]|uniref:EGF-like domain-containing protein n=1 Tax=Ancylostoma duodenale TaxID=51022 RepID=A0A0C2BUI7_9BILA|nr:hypothetical protein ANCDUO_22324 [Ancylostoma duodenale]
MVMRERSKSPIRMKARYLHQRGVGKSTRGILPDANGTSGDAAEWESTVCHGTKSKVQLAFSKASEAHGSRDARLHISKRSTCSSLDMTKDAGALLDVTRTKDNSLFPLGEDAKRLASPPTKLPTRWDCSTSSHAMIETIGSLSIRKGFHNRSCIILLRFSIDPTVPSMVAVNINEQSSMGQLAGPSYLDVQKLNAHYACGRRCPFPIACANGGMQNPNKCRTCICPSGYGGTHCGRPKAPSIRGCVGRLYAQAQPRRMRLKIAAAPRASGPRTCNYHILTESSVSPGCKQTPTFGEPYYSAVKFRVQLLECIQHNFLLQ